MLAESHRACARRIQRTSLTSAIYLAREIRCTQPQIGTGHAKDRKLKRAANARRNKTAEAATAATAQGKPSCSLGYDGRRSQGQRAHAVALPSRRETLPMAKRLQMRQRRQGQQKAAKGREHLMLAHHLTDEKHSNGDEA